jgi:hypothetical protein
MCVCKDGILRKDLLSIRCNVNSSSSFVELLFIRCLDLGFKVRG